MLRWLCTVLALVGSAAAWAQQTTLAPSPAVACLTPTRAERGDPDYPAMALKGGQPGRVKAAVHFDGGAWLPSIDILEQEGGDEFVESVRSHLRALRTPCLERGQRATLVFEYLFKPDDRKVFWGPPTDVADTGRRRLLDCVTGLHGGATPEYPLNARRANLEGRVWARVRYVAADAPPEVTLHHRPNATMLAEGVERWLRNRRMPCHQGEPVTAHMIFVFRFDQSVYGFKPMTLPQFMSRVQGIQHQRLTLDTTAMGCPFDVRLNYLQPDGANQVGEVGQRNPARQPLLGWLADAALDLRADLLDSVYADTAEIHVPCLKIDLSPKEKTP